MIRSHKKVKVIITDDSNSFLAGLENMLSGNPHFEVIEKCENGLELLKNRNLIMADLLLIDIEMPKMNGLEAASRINFQYPELPMIAITTNIKDVFLKDIIYAGFKGFIYKPKLQEELFETIDKVLSNKFSFPKDLKL